MAELYSQDFSGQGKGLCTASTWVHIILDNYSPHTANTFLFERHDRKVLHSLMKTQSSWLLSSGIFSAFGNEPIPSSGLQGNNPNCLLLCCFTLAWHLLYGALKKYSLNKFLKNRQINPHERPTLIWSQFSWAAFSLTAFSLQ